MYKESEQMPSKKVVTGKAHRVTFTALGESVSGFANAEEVNGLKSVRVKGVLELDLGNYRLSVGEVEVVVGLDGVMFDGDSSTIVIGVGGDG
jgi:hypothetical protein